MGETVVQGLGHPVQHRIARMSALFDFKAFLTVVLLTICTCTYVKLKAPSVLAERTGYVVIAMAAQSDSLRVAIQ